MNETTLKITKIDKHPVDRSEGRRYQRSVLYVWLNVPEAKPIQDLLSGFRWNQPYKIYKEHVLPEVFKQLGLPPDTEARWSQKAGCSCGCSPGFILSKTWPAQSIHVNVKVMKLGQQEFPFIPTKVA